MEYAKRNEKITTIEDSVLARAGLERNGFFYPDEEPFIKNLKEASDFLKANMDLPVTIVGDYDADGICGTAILYHTLLRAGKHAALRIPRRFSEGYGLSKKIIDEIQSGVVLTVDNGIAALDAMSAAKEKGLKVIIIDHHEPVCKDGKIILPCADVIVDPKADPEAEYRDYCGAGLAYRFSKEFLGTDLNGLLILASIATVADVMSLTGANRVLVRRGLEALNKGYGVPGLKALAASSKQYGHFNEGDYGFWFGPIFNACGRLDDNGASKALRLLTMGYNDSGMSAYVRMLQKTNDERKDMAKEQRNLAEMLVQDLEGNVERPIVVSDPMLHPGLVGIIAGGMAEKYHSPVIVFSEKDGILKGSGRSIPEVNLKNVLDRIADRDDHLMLGYGGHAGAAGLSIRSEDFRRFQESFRQSVGNIPEMPDILYYDLELRRDEIPSAAEELRKLAPFGEGNPKPVFRMVFDTERFSYARMGDGTHFALTEKDQDTRFTIVGFGMSGKYEAMKPKKIECLGYINENWYEDKLSYQFELIAFHSA